MEFTVPRFVKWAGGKHQLIEQFIPFFPTSFNKYIEPFVGSGAVAFYVIQKYNPKEVIISDTNRELMLTYEVIKNNVELLIQKLKEHKQNHSKDYYYKLRDQEPQNLSQTDAAARFIYLNRTCFNGLYRVNSKGKFNVPMGQYKDPDIVQEDKLRKITSLLQNVTTKTMPFEKTLDIAEANDFVYMDPPYYPLERGKNFTHYTDDVFLEEAQQKLADVFSELDKRGCLCMESNSDTAFIRDLYRNYHIHIVQARRPINANAKGRGEINEVVVTNYEPAQKRLSQA